MDLTLNYGDLVIEKVEESFDGISYYDIALETTDQAIAKLVKRTLKTPLSYIKTFIVEKSIEYLDVDYGNPLYRKLSENLTISFIEEVQSDIELTLSKIEDVPGLTFGKVTVINLSIDTLDVDVSYTFDNKNVISQFSLSL